jgi:hypothetical protein
MANYVYYLTSCSESRDGDFMYYPLENYNHTGNIYLLGDYKNWNKNTTFEI